MYVPSCVVPNHVVVLHNCVSYISMHTLGLSSQYDRTSFLMLCFCVMYGLALCLVCVCQLVSFFLCCHYEHGSSLTVSVRDSVLIRLIDLFLTCWQDSSQVSWLNECSCDVCLTLFTVWCYCYVLAVLYIVTTQCTRYTMFMHSLHHSFIIYCPGNFVPELLAYHVFTMLQVLLSVCNKCPTMICLVSYDLFD
jgi:hypothetical protein